jgi:hypothetical protein
MAGGTFVLLKGGRAGPESAKQAKIRLANLLKILGIAQDVPKTFQSRFITARERRAGTHRLHLRISGGYG